MAPQERSSSSCWVVRELGHILVYEWLLYLASGIVSMSYQYVLINYLARIYTDLAPDKIQCDVHMKLDFCREGAVNASRIMTVLNSVTPFVNLFLVPLTAGLSDFVGRRRLILATYLQSNIKVLLTGLHVWFGISLLPAMLAYPLSDGGPNYAVSVAAVADRLARPDRATGMSMLNAAGYIGELMGYAIGLTLPLRLNWLLSAVLVAACSVYTFCCFPETLKPCDRRSFETDDFRPAASFRLLWRSELVFRLTTIICLTAFCDSGLSMVVPTYVKLALGFNAHDSYLNGLAGDFSTALWLSFGFAICVRWYGEVGALVVGRFCVFCVNSVTLSLARTKNQVQLITLLLTGPLNFGFVAISALKSQMARDNEQGALQGALNVAYSLMSSTGSLSLGFLFQTVVSEGHVARIRGVGLSLVFASGLLQMAVILQYIWRAEALKDESKKSDT